MKTTQQARRSILSGIGAALAAFAFRPRSAQAQSESKAKPFQPTRHTQDDWMDLVQGQHRTVIDCAAAAAAGTGVFYANNIFTANRNGYQLADRDVAVIVVLRHEATTFAYNDAIWAKYGSVLGSLGRVADPRTSRPPAVNPLDSREFAPAMTNNGVTASSLASRGARFAVCDMATNRIAGVIAAAVKSTQPEIYKELVANLLPNGQMVAAGVVAISRAQERGYSMLSAG
jgi:intracellular sulfur oxidation DsrE/DsrF family protein